MLTENKQQRKKINLQNEIAFSMPREINVDVTGKAHTQNTIKDQIAKDTLGVLQAAIGQKTVNKHHNKLCHVF